MRLLPVLSLILLLVACGGQPEEAARPATATQPDPPDPATLVVGGLTCHGCRDTIASLVADDPGVRIGYFDLTDGRLTLHLQPTTDRQRLETLLDSKGFTPVHWQQVRKSVD